MKINVLIIICSNIFYIFIDQQTSFFFSDKKCWNDPSALFHPVGWQAQQGPRYVAPGRDCSLGSDVVNVIQIKILIVVILK